MQVIYEIFTTLIIPTVLILVICLNLSSTQHNFILMCLIRCWWNDYKLLLKSIKFDCQLITNLLQCLILSTWLWIQVELIEHLLNLFSGHIWWVCVLFYARLNHILYTLHTIVHRWWIQCELIFKLVMLFWVFKKFTRIVIERYVIFLVRILKCWVEWLLLDIIVVLRW